MNFLALEEVSNPLLGKTDQLSQITLFLPCLSEKHCQLPTTPPTEKAMQNNLLFQLCRLLQQLTSGRIPLNAAL